MQCFNLIFKMVLPSGS